MVFLVSKTFFSRSSKDKLPSLDLSVLSAGEPTLEDLRVLGTQIEARLSTMSKPPRVTNQLAPDVLAEVSRKMFPNIEIPPSKEVITNEGEFAFVQAKGIDLTRYLIERELLTSNISGRVKSKIVSDFVAEAAALTAVDLTHLLKEDGWALNETEWLASVPTQIADKQDDQNREGTFMANGSLVLVMSRSVLDTPPAGTENSIDGLLTACRYIESPEYIEKITKLIEQVASNNGAENVIDVSRVMSNLQVYNGIGINIGVASLEEEDVNAYYNDYRNNDAYEGSAFIGGNGPSLAARRAYANNLARPSITMAPQVAQKWGLSEATATTLVEKALKGFPTKKQMLVYEV